MVHEYFVLQMHTHKGAGKGAVEFKPIEFVKFLIVLSFKGCVGLLSTKCLSFGSNVLCLLSSTMNEFSLPIPKIINA